MIEIEDAVKYFNNVKPKHLRRFSEETPEGNHIKGWICHKHNRYLGSLLIDELNGESHEQFVQSMPKINYFNDERDVSLDDDIIGYEKLDGSCLITYPILCDKGNIMEVVPKTRGRVIADNYFKELYDKIDKSSIYNYYKTNKGVLFFEMYGILNQHEIIHYDTGIDIALIGCYDENRFYEPKDLWILSRRNLFKQPEELFRIINNRIILTTKKYKWYLDDISDEELSQPTIIDSIDKIQHILEYLNKKYNNINNRLAIEGTVLNCKNQKGQQKYIKIKPKDIENKHRNEKGIPRSAITKEVLKYFDEYGSEVKSIYLIDKNHHVEYIHKMLSEDYSEDLVMKSSKKIEKVFMQIWDTKQIPESLHNIAQELFDEYSENGITYCMKMFAQKYPMKKKDAKTVYNVLEKIYVKNKSELNGT